jgi:hypothetical protein
MGRLSRASALALGALALADCDVGDAPPYGSPPGPCDRIQCGAALQVTLTRGARWPAGRYRLRMSTASKDDQCFLTLPPSAGDSDLCPAANPWWRIRGSAQGDIVVSLRGFSAPAPITLSLSREDVVLFERVFAPTYTNVPAAPGCEPLCPTAPPETVVVPP